MIYNLKNTLKKNKQIFQKSIDYVLLASLFLFPFLFKFILFSFNDNEHPIISLNFSIADILIGVSLLGWLLKIYLYKEWRKIKGPSIPILVFLSAGLFSFVNAISIGDWLKEFIQFILYFLLYYMLLINNLKGTKITVVKDIFFINATVIIIIAFIQYMFLNVDSYYVRGLFENRNILGLYLCIAVPLVFYELFFNSSICRKIWMSVLLIFAWFILLSSSALFSILLSLFIITWFHSKKLFYQYSIIVLLLGILYPFIMPIHNINSIKEFLNIYEQGSINDNFYRRQSLLNQTDTRNLMRKYIGNKYFLITIDKIFADRIINTSTGKRYKEFDGKKHIKNRYLEMQASLNCKFSKTLGLNSH